ncbi:hypothetical protein [Weeksella sp. HMSC059D05]|uniref:hypothetical protein n=1 Tax=Weeksella sp. HMSC059D05 TaxID=1715139 RepID=UPI0008A551C3|nr:hypothetical protein [Weeksella sp. HMSC059D05]OFM83218.1 hypothetical protein HMPREF2660_01520 [Weeksella sp. HMSC059D05]
MADFHIDSRLPNDAYLDIFELTRPIPSPEQFHWRIIWLDGETDSEEFTIFSLHQLIEEKDGLLLTFENLIAVNDRLIDLTHAIIVGNRDLEKINLLTDDENLYDNEIILELVNGVWHVSSDVDEVLDAYEHALCKK